MKIITIISIIILIIAEISAINTPKYLKLCNQKDPNFSKCAVESGQNAIPHIIGGDKDLNIPNMNPLKLPFLQLAHSDTLKLNFTDVELGGLKSGILKDVVCDTDKYEAKIVFEIPEAVLKSKYNVEGRVLLPIQGTGDCEMKFYGGIYTYKFKYEFIEKKGEKYAKIITDNLQFTIKKASFHYNNLFNGDKTLGDQMNQLLNDNWNEVIKEFNPIISETIASIFRLITGRIIQKIPWNQLFSD